MDCVYEYYVKCSKSLMQYYTEHTLCGEAFSLNSPFHNVSVVLYTLVWARRMIIILHTTFCFNIPAKPFQNAVEVSSAAASNKPYTQNTIFVGIEHFPHTHRRCSFNSVLCVLHKANYRQNSHSQSRKILYNNETYFEWCRMLVS